MREFIFYFLFLFLIVFSTALTINTITGNIANHPNCPGGHTYAFYRTPAEQQAVIDMYLQAGFVPVNYEPVPTGFKTGSYEGFLCVRRMTSQEMQELGHNSPQHMQKQRVVTVGGSFG
jgi:hypothetical protein